MEKEVSRDYLVGYFDAIEEVSDYLTKAIKRNPVKPLPVLNDLIVKLHEERTESKAILREWDALEPTEDEQYALIEKELEEMFNNVLGKTVRFKVLNEKEEF